jgi:hypothetical protein
MYIRSECGIISTAKELQCQYLVDANESLIGLSTTVNFKRYKIKLQGENLIDVLEDNDMVYYETPKPFPNSLLNFKEISEDASMILYLEHMISIGKAKIITHEQYMKLAQEVK